MAEKLGVSRTTVVAAYDELLAEGLVEARVGHGTVVIGPTSRAGDALTQPIAWLAHFSALAQRLHSAASAETPALNQLCCDSDLISFAAGTPDPGLFPVERFSTAFDAVLNREGSAVWNYAPKAGIDAARELITERMSRLKVTTTNSCVIAPSR